MDRPTQIAAGVQYHHEYNLDWAYRGAVNMAQSLKGVVELTGSPEHEALRDDAIALCRRIGRAQEAARDRLRGHYDADPVRYYRCRAGLEPWPDEIAEGFEPVCTCQHRCLYHSTDTAGSTEDDCNCAEVCPRHLTPREPGDRTRLEQLPRRS